MIPVRNGVWYQYDRPLKKNPIDQVGAAKHRLIARLNEMRVNLDGLFISEVVVLPKIGDTPAEGLGPGAPRSRI